MKGHPIGHTGDHVALFIMNTQTLKKGTPLDGELFVCQRCSRQLLSGDEVIWWGNGRHLDGGTKWFYVHTSCEAGAYELFFMQLLIGKKLSPNHNAGIAERLARETGFVEAAS